MTIRLTRNATYNTSKCIYTPTGSPSVGDIVYDEKLKPTNNKIISVTDQGLTAGKGWELSIVNGSGIAEQICVEGNVYTLNTTLTTSIQITDLSTYVYFSSYCNFRNGIDCTLGVLMPGTWYINGNTYTYRQKIDVYDEYVSIAECTFYKNS